MKTFVTAFILMAMLFTASGCQKTIIREEVVSPNTQYQQPPQGTVDDGGGGNSINGRPLESYRFDILERTDVKDAIIPLVRTLSEINLRFGAALLHLLRERNWYLVPVPLRQLPQSKIGVFFDSQQMALQTRGEVWIDSGQFDTAQSHDQLILFVHELLMGMRLYRYNGDLDHCLALAAEKLLDGSKADEFAKAETSCYREARGRPENPGGILDRKIEVHPEEYTLIRRLTVRLISEPKSISASELDLWLVDAGLKEAPAAN